MIERAGLLMVARSSPAACWSRRLRVSSMMMSASVPTWNVRNRRNAPVDSRTGIHSM
jgi:hypothetical protein